MITVPRAAMPHVIAAADLELGRLEAVHRDVGDDWPVDFDANDIPLFKLVLKELHFSNEARTEDVDLSGKPLRFLLAVLPDYVSANSDSLSSLEHEALKQMYAQSPFESAKRFPDRGQGC